MSDTTAAPAASTRPGFFGFVAIPERRVCVIDVMDEALEMARTCSLALQLPEVDLDASRLESITFTLNTALGLFGAVRRVIDEAHGRTA